ncbi:ABC transporter ATP-binding protein [Lysinibacillus sphaericus]|uniref:Multidrug ABC transporter ATP-binding protein n=1 Tax=Lysinibacillus sphaericus TaxID=1421 RepID=A0A2S0JUS2_LYSSH|nr:ABC transporter ATP-binding protein [Lysinibacillus sphaericus]AVK94885.1 multidrug ABC transporter permease [Lysinibacillus sphaericus]MED4544163.1 ABC transporter ATP-binding protein [Lysinibacillus sphaericus]TKI17097.1 ABC transporter ATP-binding protein [Lysinibacillus sphaericus]SUV19979.1 multidrug ABC transporter ATP-binding protein [Lysinibacillus sphaericus]GEC83559.1 multidrug ABC transporter permease [Lysinibacillus sphaericus]
MNNSVRGIWQLVNSNRLSKKLTIGTLLLSIVETLIGLTVPLFTMRMINDFSTIGFSWQSILLVGVFLIFQAVLSGVTFYMMRKLGERIVANLRMKVWAHVLRLRIPYFDAHESGETMSRITQDTNVIKELITDHLISFISGLFAIVGAVIILIIIDWKMTLLMLISVPVAILLTLPLGQRIHKIARANQDELASFTGQLGRVLTNIRLVKTSQTENYEQLNGEEKIQHLYQFGLKESKILAVISPIMTFIMMVVLILLFGYGGAKVATGAITAGELVAIIIYLVQIIIPFTQMATFFTSLQKAMGATERLQEILNEPIEGHGKNAIAPSNESITFENVVFQYNDNPILKGISFTIPTGKTTALVSASGGGKTTMFSLIEQFYHVTEGTIRFGEQPIEQIHLKEWRSLFGYVSQEAPLMNGTIRDNVTYGKSDVLETDIIEALKNAYAWDFVQQFEKGLDTEVGEGGIKLSGGQRQRIAIARALFRNPAILLLDEATSNLDNDSERAVQKAIEYVMKGRTTVIIAHRLSTIVHADQILVFEDGLITGSGKHEELQEHHTYYKQLIKLMTQ